jgi:hypothetical protein
LIALNLDPSFLNRPTRATSMLKLGGNFQQASMIERKVGNRRHSFTTPAFRFPAKPDYVHRHLHWEAGKVSTCTKPTSFQSFDGSLGHRADVGNPPLQSETPGG